MLIHRIILLIGVIITAAILCGCRNNSENPSGPEKVASPMFTPNGGTIRPEQWIEICCTTEGAAIRYTTDGSAPDESAGMTYSDPFLFPSTGTYEAKAVALKDGMNDSDVAAVSFSVQNLEKVTPPIISPDGGTVTCGQRISISCPTEGAAIRYTTDGSTPGMAHSTVYVDPFVIPAAGDVEVRAIAVMEGMCDSDVTTALFSVPTCVMSVWNGTFETDSDAEGTINDWVMYSDGRTTGTWVSTGSAGVTIPLDGTYVMDGNTISVSGTGTARHGSYRSGYTLTADGMIAGRRGNGSFYIRFSAFGWGSERGTWTVTME